MKSCQWLWMCALAVGLSSAAQGAVVMYSSRTAWLAATAGVTTIDFEGIAAPASSVYYPGGVSIGGVTFIDALTQLYVFDALYSPGNTNWGSGASLITNASNDLVTAALPANVTAVGMDLFTVNPSGQTMLVGVSPGGIFPLATQPNPTLTFIGFVSTTPIVSVGIKGINSATGIDNFSFGTTSVPEPVTWAGMLLGLGCLVSRTRRLRRHLAPPRH